MADGDVAEKAHTLFAQGAFELTRDVFGALMVWRDATAHKAEGGGQAVENVDEGARQFAPEGVGDIAARGTGAHNADMDGGLAHGSSSMSLTLAPLKRRWK